MRHAPAFTPSRKQSPIFANFGERQAAVRLRSPLSTVPGSRPGGSSTPEYYAASAVSPKSFMPSLAVLVAASLRSFTFFMAVLVAVSPKSFTLVAVLLAVSPKSFKLSMAALVAASPKSFTCSLSLHLRLNELGLRLDEFLNVLGLDDLLGKFER